MPWNGDGGKHICDSLFFGLSQITGGLTQVHTDGGYTSVERGILCPEIFQYLKIQPTQVKIGVMWLFLTHTELLYLAKTGRCGIFNRIELHFRSLTIQKCRSIGRFAV
ncbi:hypothetical protein EVA_11724 [gut metagenome]|uniref:Uncharacterized protein n=1 Tax=gut metagenome TaxID=749906 RepID=J9GKH6_9ZZZZ